DYYCLSYNSRLTTHYIF
nr:immunoglobulin light chain junction region [Macaca mulatta]